MNRPVNLQMAEKGMPLIKVNGVPAVEVVGDPFLTIQGEGPFAGRVAVFVRLAGCNLTCAGCDTDYTTSRRFALVPELVAQVNATLKTVQWTFRHSASRPLVVITGGEPFRQTSVLYLIRGLLLADDVDVQVETNGTVLPQTDDCPLPIYSSRLFLVVSPKTTHINANLVLVADCFKYVLDHRYVDPDDGLPTVTLAGTRPARPGRQSSTVYVQPDDGWGDPDLHAANLKAAVASCLKFGYRLSLQQHKIAGIP